MSKIFLKKGEIQLINGGYLSDKEGNPVFNYTFHAAQMGAEYVVTFAEKAKGKDFKGKKADSLEELRAEVEEALKTKNKTYVTAPKEVTKKLHNQLKEEALAFLNYGEELSKTEKVNEFLQKFNVIAEFEEFGLFFEKDIYKLNKIYTIDEIVKAVESTIDLL